MSDKPPDYPPPYSMRYPRNPMGMPRLLTDNPSNGQSTSAMFDRQDSLTLAANFQQRDRERFPGDFMETELDLNDYLECFTNLDVPAEHVDWTDAELQKVNILYDEDVPLDQQPTTSSNLNGYERHVTYGPGFRRPDLPPMPPPRPVPAPRKVAPMTPTRRSARRPYPKEESDGSSEEEEEIGESTIPSGSDSYYEPKSKRKRTALQNFRPQTRARNYTLKPDEEKAEPTYQLKRARNNDAVRKSRNKTKEAQQKRDEEHANMKKRIAELEAQLEAEKEGRRRDQEMIETLLRANQRPAPPRNDRNPLGNARRFNR